MCSTTKKRKKKKYIKDKIQYTNVYKYIKHLLFKSMPLT